MTKACKYFCLAVAALFLTICPSARADTAYLDLTGAGNNVADGVYVGPYTATINGVTTLVICDDYSHESYLNDPWWADTSTFPTLTDARFTGPNEIQNYDEVAYLAGILFGLSGDDAQADAVQFAIWYINDPTDVDSTQCFGSADVDCVSYWLSQASSQNFTPNEFTNLMLYTPVGGGNPQEFIVETPEPAVILLLAIGLLAVLVIKRRPSAISLA